MYPENPQGTQVIVGSMNMGYISDTARNPTHNLFRPKREPIPLGHSDGQISQRYLGVDEWIVYYEVSVNTFHRQESLITYVGDDQLPFSERLFAPTTNRTENPVLESILAAVVSIN